MKVSEAQEKVCPFIQEASIFNAGDNYSDGVHANINCICGDCMAWIYTQTHKQIENKIDTSSKSDCAARYRDGEELKEEDKHGICVRLRGMR